MAEKENDWHVIDKKICQLQSVLNEFSLQGQKYRAYLSKSKSLQPELFLWFLSYSFFIEIIFFKIYELDKILFLPVLIG